MDLQQSKKSWVRIGKGACSVVYKAKLHDNVPYVAVKVLREQGYVSMSLKRMLQNERDLAQNHPFIVRLHGYCEKNPSCLLYEYMGGGDLQQVLRSKEKRALLSLCRRVLLLYQAAIGLAFLHHECKPPILHWDVKPSNILVNDSLCCAKLGDLGISRRRVEDESLRSSEQAVGP